MRIVKASVFATQVCNIKARQSVCWRIKVSALYRGATPDKSVHLNLFPPGPYSGPVGTDLLITAHSNRKKQGILF
ncbi:hypothetical protein DPMN_177420 [Dreissena polymorpha]|nr:hypothetical protein DPMN_177420 [Dreissena polymorpha]